MKTITTLSLAFALLFAVGCGGGSKSASTPTPPPTSTQTYDSLAGNWNIELSSTQTATTYSYFLSLPDTTRMNTFSADGAFATEENGAVTDGSPCLYPQPWMEVVSSQGSIDATGRVNLKITLAVNTTSQTFTVDGTFDQTAETLTGTFSANANGSCTDSGTVTMTLADPHAMSTAVGVHGPIANGGQSSTQAALEFIGMTNINSQSATVNFKIEDQTATGTLVACVTNGFVMSCQTQYAGAGSCLFEFNPVFIPTVNEFVVPYQYTGCSGGAVMYETVLH